MFPFQQNNEFSSHISADPHQENPFLQQTCDFANITGEDQLPPNLAYSDTTNDPNLASRPEKKTIRKEIERQRRQQMSTLHASLRNLLPLESIKGKRSMSDHIDEAAKYIKTLENNVQELSMKRDKLKNLSNSGSLDEQRRNDESSYSMRNSSTVTVHSHLGGVEIVISCGSKEESFIISRVLEAVIEEGFDVLSCISTKRDERLYNTIQCQPSHLTCIGTAALQQKLNDVILST